MDRRYPRYAQAFLLLTLFIAVPALACDADFIQEPTYAEPTDIGADTVLGMIMATYRFPDNRVLITLRTKDVAESDEEAWSRPPSMYMVIIPGKGVFLYVDWDKKGLCMDIKRYQPWNTEQ